jgi:hypothetical protein
MNGRRMQAVHSVILDHIVEILEKWILEHNIDLLTKYAKAGVENMFMYRVGHS